MKKVMIMVNVTLLVSSAICPMEQKQDEAADKDNVVIAGLLLQEDDRKEMQDVMYDADPEVPDQHRNDLANIEHIIKMCIFSS